MSITSLSTCPCPSEKAGSRDFKVDTHATTHTHTYVICTGSSFLLMIHTHSHPCTPVIHPLSDLQLDYSLTDDFCRNHFLVGLLLREVGGALQELHDIRQIAIQVLKSLMIKHTFDERYSAKVRRTAHFIYSTQHHVFAQSKPLLPGTQLKSFP